MRIRFTVDKVFETRGRADGVRFPEGTVLDEDDVGAALGVDCGPEYARGFLMRWVNRNAAVEVDGRIKPSEIVPPAPEPEPEAKPAPVPAPASAIRQPLGTAKRGRPTKGAGA